MSHIAITFDLVYIRPANLCFFTVYNGILTFNSVLNLSCVISVAKANEVSTKGDVQTVRDIDGEKLIM